MKALFPILIFLGGCASISARLPPIENANLEAEQARQETAAFSEMKILRARLHKVAAPILTANADICKKTALDMGALTHTLKNYPKDLREAAARETDARETPSLVFVRAGSPAEQKDLLPGDVLHGPEGKPLSAPSAKLSEYLKDETPVTRVRGGEKREILLTGELRCDYSLKLKMTPTINAYATGKSIIVTSGMMNFTKNDTELAMIIGHELAHNERGHIRKIVTNYIISLGGTRYTRGFESEADYAGLYYMARAGYDLEGVEDLWRRLAKVSLRPIVRAKTHPAYPDRYVRIAAARAEIKAKQAAGEPLLPNEKTKK